MLRPEHRQFDSLDRLSVHSDRETIQPARQSRLVAEASDTEALMESLMPKGISPAKQAIIERLIEMWVAKSELDVA
ncbi:MAG: hypothetical protein ACAF41_09390 [Leptolyngbya sp. BL-A-14]